ncbi:MAG: hypothetical protein C5B51_14570 [Terriglobia bacterium]|nr:MAG: hypothetical protein C5B51_14570 [Terriglobia bacterium]
MSHPTDHELDAFLGRGLSGAALVELDGHLAGCGPCRARLESRARVETSSAWLRREIEQAPRREHLSDEAVRALAEGRPAAVAGEHVRNCAMCRSEVEDLRAFITAQASARLPRTRWYALAAALLVAAFLPFGWRLWQKPALPPEYRAILEQATRSGRLEIPQEIAALHRKPELLLGAPEKPAAFGLRQPLGEAVPGGQPVFVWESLSGASAYTVSVYDEQFRKVMESPELSGTEWRPDQALTAGHIYSWTVTAQVNGDRVRVPVPPAPEAKFAVLSASEAGRLAEARRRYPEQHLLLASLFARVGVVSEARKELAADGSELARRLESSLP